MRPVRLPEGGQADPAIGPRACPVHESAQAAPVDPGPAVPGEEEGASEPNPRAVKCGRGVLCTVGATCLAVAGVHAHSDPQGQVLLTAVVLGAGLVCVWLGLALAPRAVAHVGFWLPLLLPEGD